MVHARVRTLCAILIVGLAAVFSTGCTPAEIDAFLSMGPTPFSLETATKPQLQVISALQEQQYHENQFYLGVLAAEQAKSLDCIGAMHQVFPASVWGWAEGIIRRESGNDPGADNPTSSAAGCWQMLSMHDWRYGAVGCSAAQKYEALCNNKAAYHLYAAAGTSPWRL